MSEIQKSEDALSQVFNNEIFVSSNINSYSSKEDNHYPDNTFKSLNVIDDKKPSKDPSNLLTQDLLKVIDEDNLFETNEEENIMFIERVAESNLYNNYNNNFNFSQCENIGVYYNNMNNARSYSNFHNFIGNNNSYRELPRIFSCSNNLNSLSMAMNVNKPNSKSGMNLTTASSSFSMNGRSGWVCSFCKNFNFQMRTECNICGKAQEMSYQFPIVLSQDSLNGASQGFNWKKKRMYTEREGDWICERCKNINFSFRTNCNLCHLPKP